MKKIYAACLLAGLLSLSLLAGCQPQEQAPQETDHVHSFAAQWSRDMKYHWHPSLCEHVGEVSDRAEHEFGDDPVCDICGYKAD